MGAMDGRQARLKQGGISSEKQDVDRPCELANTRWQL